MTILLNKESYNLQEYLDGMKNPISALMELCVATHLTAKFREAVVEKPTFLAKFANVCEINGREFPQGVGSNKKAAKTDAATIAINHLLGTDPVHVEGLLCFVLNHCIPYLITYLFIGLFVYLFLKLWYILEHFYIV